MSKKKRKSDSTNVRGKDELLTHISAVTRFVRNTSGDPSLLRYLDEMERAVVATSTASSSKSTRKK